MSLNLISFVFLINYFSSINSLSESYYSDDYEESKSRLTSSDDEESNETLNDGSDTASVILLIVLLALIIVLIHLYSKSNTNGIFGKQFSGPFKQGINTIKKKVINKSSDPETGYQSLPQSDSEDEKTQSKDSSEESKVSSSEKTTLSDDTKSEETPPKKVEFNIFNAKTPETFD